MVTFVGNGYRNLSSNPGWVYLHSTSTFRKGMNPTILSLAMGKTIEQTGPWYGNQSMRKKTPNSNFWNSA